LEESAATTGRHCISGMGKGDLTVVTRRGSSGDGAHPWLGHYMVRRAGLAATMMTTSRPGQG
jgi:hypothetical protein